MFESKFDKSVGTESIFEFDYHLPAVLSMNMPCQDVSNVYSKQIENLFDNTFKVIPYLFAVIDIKPSKNIFLMAQISKLDRRIH